jgi:hypothetical protein
MNITNYRQYLVRRDKWSKVLMTVPPRSPGTRFSWQRLHHPLVTSKKAWWLNDTTLCLGYQLMNNPDIFRPIFGTNRQRKINQFQNNINRVVEKRKEKLAFIELFKIKRFPRVLVEKIIKLAY